MTKQVPTIRELLGSETRVPPRKSLAEEAADQLRELILIERLKPGLPVPERDLAEGIGISRTPLREALRILESEGLIEYSSTRRPHVANPSMEEIADNLLVIGALEALAGELVCEKASSAEIDRIAGLCKQMEAGTDTVSALEFFGWDMEFHTLIVETSRSPPLIATHRQYNARLWRARFISSRMRLRRANTLRQHEEIVTSLATRDASATSRALRAHMKAAVHNIALALQESGYSEAPQ